MVLLSLISSKKFYEAREKRQQVLDAQIEVKCRLLEKLRNEHLLNNDFPSEGQKEFYAGKSILVTGGTGFIGKVLIEKLLRTVPTVGNIFVIVRPKKNQTPAERMKTVLSNELFDQVKSQQPNALEKVIAIHGDMSLKGLGLSLEDRERLQNEVSIVFHSAASVRFDDPLQKAILLNTRGTREVVQLCKSMKNLKCLLHVSTTYCNTDQKITEEKVYPTPMDWRYVVKLAETTSLEDLEAISPKLLGFQPNTYLFTKQLAEKIVDEARLEIPVVIVRPAVVVGITADPIPGWTDSFYGPVGFLIGISKGVLRVLYIDPKAQLNYSSVDATCAVLLAAAWLRGTNTKISDDPHTIDVVNVSTSEFCDANYGDLKNTIRRVGEKSVYPQIIRAPRITYTTNTWYFYYRVYVSHLLVGAILDLILWLAGQKRQLISVYRKIHNVNKELLYFMVQNFPQKTENLWRTMGYVTEPDLQIIIRFSLSHDGDLQLKYCLERLLKDPLSSRRVHEIYEVLHYVQQTIKYLFFAWLGWKCALYIVHYFMATYCQ